MKKCDACGKRFKLLKENRYEAVDIPVGLDCLTQPSTYYNAFDCPYCGCQNLVGEIKRCKSRPKEEDNFDEVLEKIKDDIKNNSSHKCVSLVPENNRAITVHDAIQIIDKYRSNKEVEE